MTDLTGNEIIRLENGFHRQGLPYPDLYTTPLDIANLAGGPIFAAIRVDLNTAGDTATTPSALAAGKFFVVDFVLMTKLDHPVSSAGVSVWSGAGGTGENYATFSVDGSLGTGRGWLTAQGANSTVSGGIGVMQNTAPIVNVDNPAGTTATANFYVYGKVSPIPFIGAIYAITLTSGGGAWFNGDIYYVSGGDGTATGVVDTTTPAQAGPFTISGVHQGGGTASITAVNQGAKTFTAPGDWTALLYAGGTGTVTGSTGNDGTYSVVSAIFGSGNTVVTVSQSIPSAVADGRFIDFGVLTVTGDHVAAATVGQTLKISDSSGNNGAWTKSPAVLVSGNTRITVLGPIPAQGPLLSPVAGGTFVTGGIIATTHIIVPGAGYSLANGVALLPDGSESGTGGTINITGVA